MEDTEDRNRVTYTPLISNLVVILFDQEFIPILRILHIPADAGRKVSSNGQFD